MTDAVSYEFALFGSTPLATLLAGLLARPHGRRVLLVGNRPSRFRVPGEADLSAALMTRPESWALLHKTLPETQKLLGRMGGAAAFRRVDVQFIAESAETAAALGHMRHMAQDTGFAIEPVEAITPGARAACRLRDAVLLDRVAFDGAAEDWLAKAGVRRVAAPGARATLKRDGSGRIEAGGETIGFNRAVFVDDAAIRMHLPAEERERLFVSRVGGALLTEPAPALAATVLLLADRGAMLVQRPDGAVWAHSTVGEPVAALGAALPEPLTRVQRAAAAPAASLLARDGAPVIGGSKAFRGTIIGGLGMPAAFFAPALARFVAGVAEPDEQVYFAAREPGAARAGIADVAPAVPAEAA